ncbi:MAG: hypothetical protein AAB323_01865 [Pseudomonadota bacterium]
MVVQQILGNIDAALNECCDQSCNDINIKKLMMALRQLETQLCETDQNECVAAPHHHKKYALQDCRYQAQPHFDACADNCRPSFFCSDFANILLMGLLIGVLVGMLVYIFNKSSCCQTVCC